MKKVLISLVVMALVLVVTDRVAVTVAQRAISSQVAASGELSGKPTVSIGGFPFLTQALSGRYSSIEVHADGVADNQGVAQFDATLTGVRLPLSAVLSGSIDNVPVGSLDARVVLTYAELERRVANRRLKLSAAGDLLRVTGSVTVLGRTLSASALSSLSVSGGDVRVTAQRFEVGVRPADAVLTKALGKRLDFAVRVGALPYGLTLTSAAAVSTGIEATAVARNTTLTR
ncbi:MAG: DUF2993 domain-containing protein [Mycobacteriales bacterium]